MKKRIKKSYLLIIPIIICINFFLPRIMPGDPFLYLSVEDGNVSATFSEEQIEQYKEYYGLDEPIFIQFIKYIKKLLHGDLGVSIYYNTPVTKMILERIPWTLLIVLVSLSISVLVGTLIGSISAWKRQGRFDQTLYTIMLFLTEIPGFLIATILLFVVAADLKWFPLSGGRTAFASYDTVGEKAVDIINHMVLPVTTLVVARAGHFYFIARSSLLTVLSKDYIKTAQGKGLRKYQILFTHALRNSLPPVVMQIFMSLGVLLGQAVLVESVFAYPGIGSLMRESVLNRDYILMQGIFLIMAANIFLMNILADIAIKKLDPRMV